MITHTPLDQLAAALQIEGGELVSLVGGGGKTTTLFTLGEQLHGTTVLTTTTKMGADQSSDFPLVVDPSDAELMAEVHTSGRVLAWKTADHKRATGVSTATCDRWFSLVDNVIVEADGSRKRPFKAPASHEPVVPGATTLLIACIGARAFGRPIAESCHRPEQVAELAGCRIEDHLTPARATAVLLSTQGSQKGLPPASRFAVALHRVTPDLADLVAELGVCLDGRAPLVAVADRGQPN